MSVKVLAAELGEVHRQTQLIIDDPRWRDNLSDMPAELKMKLEALLSKAEELKPRLDLEHELEKKANQVRDLHTYLESPQYKTPRGAINADSDGRQTMLQAGWEIKSGQVYAPTSLGPHPMYPERVLFGTPQGEDEERYFGQVRAALQPEYKEVFNKWFATAIRTKNEAMAFTLLEPSEQKALSEGIDQSGGYLVPPDMQAEVLARLPMNAVMRGMAMVRQTSRDVLRFPRIQPAPGTTSGLSGALGADGGSIFTSGFVGSWAGETPAFQDVDPAFGFFDIPIRKIRVATRLSNDFLADAITNPLTFLSTDGARNMALVEDQGFIRGDGGPMQPQGIVNAPIAALDVTGTTAHTISNTTATMGSAPKLMNLQYALPSQYQNGAQWLLHRLTENDIRQLVNGMGAFIWAPGFDSPQPALLGKPVNKSDFVTHPAATGDVGLVYGDFSSYIIAERAMITITILRERFADTDQTGIILWERVGGAPWNIDAFRLGNVT